VNILLIGLGGFAGAVGRYLVDGWVAERTSASAFPWGTFVVNVSGSLILGVLTALVIDRSALPAALRGPVLIGFVGAYTTFSTYMLETWRLVEAGSWNLALVNLFASVGIGLLAIFAGLMIGRAV
jgi:fluoride exporter